MKNVIVVTLALVFSLQRSFCQNEASKWYFGAKAGLDFSTNPPTVLLNSSMSAYAGCASIADSSGNLLFYTKGDTIWNRAHQVMANGFGLSGNTNAAQSSLIIKQPGSNKQFYVFTIQTQGISAGLAYSIVDISLAAGMGSVTAKNVPVYTGSCSEKITATKHCNGTDYWIVITNDNFLFQVLQNFRVYLLSAQGLNLTPIISTISASPTFSSGAGGAMKISPNGKRIGLANNSPNSKSYELLDFDNSNGSVSNPLVLGYSYGYGCEFSPDGTKFYGSEFGPLTGLYQWDLSLSTSSAIASSQIFLGSANGALQIAPNGKIYARQLNQQILSVINYPDSAGLACNFVYNGLSIAANSSQLSLPNFPGNVFQTAQLTFSTSGSFSMCAGETRTINVYGATSYTWNGSNIGQSLIVMPHTTSSYSVVGTTINGCVYKATVTLTVSNCLEISENEMAEFKLFPNPASDFLRLQVTDFLTYNDLEKYRIYNSIGQLVSEEDLEFESGGFNIKTDGLGNGVYLLQLESRTTETLSKRFVINH